VRHDRNVTKHPSTARKALQYQSDRDLHPSSVVWTVLAVAAIVVFIGLSP
jgi:hypothetical protein